MMILKCPICGKTVQKPPTEIKNTSSDTTGFFPFCSQRCRLIDLGAWLDQKYAIPADKTSSPPDQPETDNSESDDEYPE